MSDLIQLLENHGIETKVRGGHVYAKEEHMFNGVPGTDWIDVTLWTIREANEWLGY